MLQILKNRIKTEIAKKQLKKEPPILIYQMGKVGSMSIYTSLKKVYPGLVLHLHNIDRQLEIKPDLRVFYNNYLQNKEQPVYIISLIREPFSRNISDFFQNFEKYVGTQPSDYKGTVEDLIEIFIDRFPHQAVLNWFDINIKKHFDIDVYDHSFPDRGSCIIKKNNHKLLLMKYDLSDSSKIEQISSFLKIDQFELWNENVGINKPYKRLYTEFLDQIKLPERIVEPVITSKYFTHFYEDEKKELMKKWQ